MNYKNRQKKILKLIEEKEIDGIVIISNENIFYLTGAPLNCNKFLYLSRDGNLYIITNEMNYQEIIDSVEDVNVIKTENFIEEIKKLGKKVGFENKKISYYTYEELKKDLELIPIGNYIEEMREIKDEDEIKLIKESQRITEKSLEESLKEIKIGMSELEIVAKIEYFMRIYGAESYAFDSIVLSGIRCIYPHGRPTRKIIEKNEGIIIDIGVRYNGYCSDMTRTIFIGEPSKNVIDIYYAVKYAQEEAIKNAKPGITGKELNEIAINVLKEYKLEKYFNHGLGHGIGINVHEEPFINKKQEKKLKCGNVITIEPGVYIPKVIGIRIEDMILITENSNKNLTNFEKMPIVL
jgi:Xaa-Pro aminopeptidase